MDYVRGVVRGMEAGELGDATRLYGREVGRWAVLHPDAAQAALAPTVQTLPETPEQRLAYRVTHLESRLAVSGTQRVCGRR